MSIHVLPAQLLSHPPQKKATITIRSENTELNGVTLYSPNLKQRYLHEEKDWFWAIEVKMTDGIGTTTLDLAEPLPMRIRIGNRYHHNLFISPGDQLNITIPATAGGDPVVTGKGSENNQPLRTTIWFETDGYEGDTLPDRILEDLKERQRKDSATLSAYIQQHNPGKAFIEAHRLNQHYFVPKEFYRFAGNHKYVLQRNPNGSSLVKQWLTVVEERVAEMALDNDRALIAPNYTDFIRDFLLRKKEALWQLMREDISAFARDWYNSDEELAKRSFADDPENLLTEKIINRYFSGETAAFAYAHLLHNAIGKKEDHVVSIYDRFKTAYPESRYLSFLQPGIEPVREKETRELNGRMVFLDETGSLRTFAQVLDLVKGKTVLLDMWGTWCVPCRQEIDRHSQALKDYFKDKKVDFLYAANYDTDKEEKWKKLIAYYRLEGLHILASQELTKDIMAKTGGRGFPTYVVIKPDGTYELSKASYPMNREKLIKQIEEAL